jgi:hypothetical protein
MTIGQMSPRMIFARDLIELLDFGDAYAVSPGNSVVGGLDFLSHALGDSSAIDPLK